MPLGCKINGQIVTEERNVMLLEDPCLKCRCDGGRMTCSKKACPVLHCPVSAMERLPGDCCPRCMGLYYYKWNCLRLTVDQFKILFVVAFNKDNNK